MDTSSYAYFVADLYKNVEITNRTFYNENDYFSYWGHIDLEISHLEDKLNIEIILRYAYDYYEANENVKLDSYQKEITQLKIQIADLSLKLDKMSKKNKEYYSKKEQLENLKKLYEEIKEANIIEQNRHKLDIIKKIYKILVDYKSKKTQAITLYKEIKKLVIGKRIEITKTNKQQFADIDALIRKYRENKFLSIDQKNAVKTELLKREQGILNKTSFPQLTVNMKVNTSSNLKSYVSMAKTTKEPFLRPEIVNDKKLTMHVISINNEPKLIKKVYDNDNFFVDYHYVYPDGRTEKYYVFDSVAFNNYRKKSYEHRKSNFYRILAKNHNLAIDNTWYEDDSEFEYDELSNYDFKDYESSNYDSKDYESSNYESEDYESS